MWLLLQCPLLGTWPATQACAGTGNQTNDPLVHWPELNLLSYTSQGLYVLFYLILLTTFPSRYHWEVNYPFFKKNIFFYFFIFRERKWGRKREKHQCVSASSTPPTGDLAGNPGMCPDWESNLRPFGSQAGAQSTEPHQPGL